MTDYSTFTDQQLVEERMAIDTEVNKRHQLTTIPEAMATMNVDYLNASGTAEGEPWRQPTGAHDAYPLDWVVTHVDKTWESLVASNVWEPGVSSWREQAPAGGGYPAWVAPTGAHDAYAKGAKVSHAGKNWTSDLDANVWEPGAYGWTEE